MEKMMEAIRSAVRFVQLTWLHAKIGYLEARLEAAQR